MSIPGNLKYAKSHEWLEELDNGNVRVGITDHAQNAMGSLVFISLPNVGDELEAGESFGDVESVKTVSEVNVPVGGRVAAVNEALLDSPEQVNDAPYEAWMIELEGVGEHVGLLSADEYARFLEEEAEG